MKKVIYISYFHSRDEHVASIRSQRFYDILCSIFSDVRVIHSAMGVPTIYNRISHEAKNCQILRLRRSSSYLSSLLHPLVLASGKLVNLFFVDWGWLWAFRVFFCLREVILTDSVDLIIISGGPFLQFLSVCLASYIYNKPYVLDYRDSWTSNPHYLWYQKLFACIWKMPEKFLLERSSLAITACNAISSELSRDANNLITIYNYPEKEYYKKFFLQSCQDVAIKSPAPSQKFKIVYAGSIFSGNNLEPFCKALVSLPTSLVSILEFHYFGLSSTSVIQTFDRFGLRPFLRVHGLIPKAQLVNILVTFDLAICTVCSLSSPSSALIYGEVPSKLFDYLLANLPSLVIAPPLCEVSSILQAINAPLVYRVDPLDTQSMVRLVMRLHLGKMGLVHHVASAAQNTSILDKLFSLTDSSNSLLIQRLLSL